MYVHVPRTSNLYDKTRILLRACAPLLLIEHVIICFNGMKHKLQAWTGAPAAVGQGASFLHKRPAQSSVCPATSYVDMLGVRRFSGVRFPGLLGFSLPLYCGPLLPRSLGFSVSQLFGVLFGVNSEPVRSPV